MSSENQQLLLARCIGLKAEAGGAEARMLGEPNDPVYSSVERPARFFPSVLILKEEVKLRLILRKIPTNECPAISKMKRLDAMKWLRENPVGNKVDIDYALFYEKKLYDSTVADSSKKEASAKAKLKTQNWSQPYPYLRLYCCFCDDEVRQALTRKDDALTRPQLDARNHQDRPETPFQMVARLYNSDKVYTTIPLGDMHSFFSEAHVLNFDEMPGGEITPEEAKDRWADARAKTVQVRTMSWSYCTVKLLLVSKSFFVIVLGRKIVTAWERSGNGSGQRILGDDDDFGQIGEDSFEDGDNRASFIKTHKGQREHHLYLWYLSDVTGILNTVLNMLSTEVAAESGGTAHRVVLGSGGRARGRPREPDAMAVAMERQGELDRRQEFRTDFNNNMFIIALSSKKGELRQLKDRLFTLEVGQTSATTDRQQECYTVHIASIKDDIAASQCEIDAMIEEHNAHGNRNSSGEE